MNTEQEKSQVVNIGNEYYCVRGTKLDIKGVFNSNELAKLLKVCKQWEKMCEDEKRGRKILRENNVNGTVVVACN